jgi:hypothetical protein
MFFIAGRIEARQAEAKGPVNCWEEMISGRELRRDPRFLVREAAVISYRDRLSAAIVAVTENLSTRGVLLRSVELIPEGSKVDITIKIPTGAHLKAAGVVTRTSQKVADGPFLIAVACDVVFDVGGAQQVSPRIVKH